MEPSKINLAPAIVHMLMEAPIENWRRSESAGYAEKCFVTNIKYSILLPGGFEASVYCEYPFAIQLSILKKGTVEIALDASPLIVKLLDHHHRNLGTAKIYDDLVEDFHAALFKETSVWNEQKKSKNP